MRTLLSKILAPSPPGVAVWAAVLRIVAGLIFIRYGLAKFRFHSKEVADFDRYGLPSPSLFVYMIGTLEFGAGCLLVAGLGTRLAALALAGNMVGAISTAGRVDGGFINLGLAPTLFVAMLFLLWAGPGRWALDGRVRQALLGVFVVVLTAGCGGGDTLTKKQYVSKLNAMCEDFSAREKKIEPQSPASPGEKESRVLDAFERAIDDKVGDLKPPKEIAGQAARLTEIAHQTRDTLAGLAAAAKSNDFARVPELASKNAALNRESNTIARKLGAKACA